MRILQKKGREAKGLGSQVNIIKNNLKEDDLKMDVHVIKTVPIEFKWVVDATDEKCP